MAEREEMAEREDGLVGGCSCGYVVEDVGYRLAYS